MVWEDAQIRHKRAAAGALTRRVTLCEASRFDKHSVRIESVAPSACATVTLERVVAHSAFGGASPRRAIPFEIEAALLSASHSPERIRGAVRLRGDATGGSTGKSIISNINTF